MYYYIEYLLLSVSVIFCKSYMINNWEGPSLTLVELKGRSYSLCMHVEKQKHNVLKLIKLNAYRR